MGGPGVRHPWHEFRRRPHIELIYDDIADHAGGAIYARRCRRAAIVDRRTADWLLPPDHLVL